MGLLESVLSDSLPLYDGIEPTFFESPQEAALHFDQVFRPLLDFDATSRTASDGRVCRSKHVDGDVSAIAFSGIGQWWLRAVHGEGSYAVWPDRQAPRDCQSPPGAIAVIDLCKMADCEVREGFLPYGAAAFFGAKRTVLAVFLPKLTRSGDAASEMIFAPDGGSSKETTDAWEFALWRFKSSMYWLTFGVFHLVHCHWITSNSLAIATREELSSSHPVRQLVWPFLHNAVTINFAAGVKLTSKQGALVRVTSHTFDASFGLVEWLSKAWRYETFEEQLASSGLPAEILDTMPFVQDGRLLWQSFSSFVSDYLAIFYSTDVGSAASRGISEGRRHLVDDFEIMAFWAAVDKAAMQSRRFGLSQHLTFDALVDYLTHAMFTLTGVHEMLGHILVDMTLPTNAGAACAGCQGLGYESNISSVQDQVVDCRSPRSKIIVEC